MAKTTPRPEAKAARVDPKPVAPDPAVLHLLSVPEAAGRLGITPKQVWRMVANGEIASVKLGRRRLIPSLEVDRFIHRLINQSA